MGPKTDPRSVIFRWFFWATVLVDFFDHFLGKMQKPENLKIAESIVPANRFEGLAAWKKQTQTSKNTSKKTSKNHQKSRPKRSKKTAKARTAKE